MDRVFHALSDPTRRAMLHHLAGGGRTVGDLAAPHSMSLSAASRHIKVLESAGLIRREVNWRTHLCHLEAAPLAEASREIAMFERFWTGRLDALEQLLREDDRQTAAQRQRINDINSERKNEPDDRK